MNGDAEADMFRPWLLPELTDWLVKRIEPDCQRKGNWELFPLCCFTHLTKKKKILLGKASPASSGANVHNWSWKPDLRAARILQTPLYNAKPCLISYLSQKTPYGNIKYTQEKNPNEPFCQQKMLHLGQKLWNSAQSHPSPCYALRDELPPSTGPACVEVGARWPCMHLDLRFKKAHHSHNSRQ